MAKSAPKKEETKAAKAPAKSPKAKEGAKTTTKKK